MVYNQQKKDGAPKKTEPPPKNNQVTWEKYVEMTSSFANPTKADWKAYNESLASGTY